MVTLAGRRITDECSQCGLILTCELCRQGHGINVVAPTDGWQTNPPTWEVGKYMWQKTRLSYGNGTTSESDPVCIYGSSENGLLVEESTTMSVDVCMVLRKMQTR